MVTFPEMGGELLGKEQTQQSSSLAREPCPVAALCEVGRAEQGDLDASHVVNSPGKYPLLREGL